MKVQITKVVLIRCKNMEKCVTGLVTIANPPLWLYGQQTQQQQLFLPFLRIHFCKYPTDVQTDMNSNMIMDSDVIQCYMWYMIKRSIVDLTSNTYSILMIIQAFIVHST